MTLREYLDKNAMSPLDFSRLVKISNTAIYKYLKGRKPQRRLAFKIEKATNGEVSARELLGEHLS
jgi:predicted transcriptional regulator